MPLTWNKNVLQLGSIATQVKICSKPIGNLQQSSQTWQLELPVTPAAGPSPVDFFGHLGPYSHSFLALRRAQSDENLGNLLEL